MFDTPNLYDGAAATFSMVTKLGVPLSDRSFLLPELHPLTEMAEAFLAEHDLFILLMA